MPSPPRRIPSALCSGSTEAGCASLGARPRCSVRPVVPAGKSLEDQVREIEKLIGDARETLAQAEWALETLVQRIRRDEDEAGAPG
jgi:hypothetical protein